MRKEKHCVHIQVLSPSPLFNQGGGSVNSPDLFKTWLGKLWQRSQIRSAAPFDFGIRFEQALELLPPKGGKVKA